MRRRPMSALLHPSDYKKRSTVASITMAARTKFVQSMTQWMLKLLASMSPLHGGGSFQFE